MAREQVGFSRNGRESNGKGRDTITAEKNPDDRVNRSDGKLVYAPRHYPRTVELFVDNLKCLAPSTYLNDEVIQFYTAYLIAECCNAPQKMHVFDNLFHDRLRETFHGDINKPWEPTRWKQLKNWFSSVNIFEKDFLIFPICQQEHWLAIIVCYPNEVRDCDGHSTSPDSESSSRNKPLPGIMILDSLGLKKPLLTSEVRYFLDFEWRTRFTVIKDFFYHNLPQYHPKLPKQTNAYDCGIFMLAYLKAFIETPERFYRLVRKSHDKEIEGELTEMINNSLTKCGREAIKTLIHRKCSTKPSNNI
jgi:ubiquitin-like-specific protease 1C/D